MNRQLKNRIIRTMGMRQPFGVSGVTELDFWNTQSVGFASANPAVNVTYCFRISAAAIRGTFSQIRVRMQGGTIGSDIGIPIQTAMLAVTPAGQPTNVTVSDAFSVGGNNSFSIPSGFDQHVNPGLPQPIFSDWLVEGQIDNTQDYYILFYSGNSPSSVLGEVTGFTKTSLFAAATPLTGNDTGSLDMSIFTFPASATAFISSAIQLM